MNPDHERVRNLLTDTVTMLCKNGLQFNSDLRVEGLIGITIDSSDVFLVHLNEKFAAASDNIEHSDSIIEAVRKKTPVHSRVNKSESRSTIEILPEAGGQVDDTHSITDIDSADFVSSDNQEPGVVSEAPASPSKKRRKRRSSKGSRSNTPASDLVQGDQEDTNLSSPGVNIKFEPTNEDDDDDLILVNSELPKPRKTNSLHVNSEANALGLVTLEGLQAQANFSGFEGITGPPPSKRSRNTDPMDPSAGAFVTGIVKNTSGEEVPLDGASWNSIGGDISMSPLLAGGLPTVPGALIDDNSPKNIAAWSGGQRTGASAAQGSSQSDSGSWKDSKAGSGFKCPEKMTVKGQMSGIALHQMKMQHDKHPVLCQQLAQVEAVRQHLFGIKPDRPDADRALYAKLDPPGQILRYRRPQTIRRPVESQEKRFFCMYPGCGLSFYEGYNLNRHQRMKGHTNKYVRPKSDSDYPKPE